MKMLENLPNTNMYEVLFKQYLCLILGISAFLMPLFWHQVKSSLWAADGLHDPDIAAINGGQC